MVVVTAFTVALGMCAADLPASELRLLAKQVALPAGAAERWDAIGIYSLKGEKADTTIKLYYEDSDSIAERAARKGGCSIQIYPNFFSIHAIYREGDGPWKDKELYSGCRVGFWKVAEVKPDAITIQVRSKLMIVLNGPIRFTDEDIKRILEPRSMRLTVQDGVPVLK